MNLKSRLRNNFYKLNLKRKTMQQYFELPHLNCQLLEIDTIPYNLPVQQLQMPFEPFADVDFYGVIIHSLPQMQTAKYMDMNTNEVKDTDILEFIGARPDPRR